MTNEQMIRELRAVAEKYKGKHVFTCETNINLMATDAANRIQSLCDEINRQKAEIDDLIEIAFMDISEEIKQLRAEAIKEFAERVKAKAYSNNYWHEFVLVSDIDNLVKEFTEGEKQ